MLRIFIFAYLIKTFLGAKLQEKCYKELILARTILVYTPILITVYITLALVKIALSRFSTSEHFRAKRLFSFVLELSVALSLLVENRL